MSLVMDAVQRWLVSRCVRLVALCVLLGAGSAAQATCATGATAAPLGTISSLALITTAQGGFGAGGVVCTGGLTLLGGSYVRVQLEQTVLTMTNAGYSIPFTVGTSSSSSTNLQNGMPTDLSSLQVVAVGAQSGIALYFNAPPGANVQAGTYTGTVNLRWYYAICDGGVLVACNWSRSPGLTQSCISNLCGSVTAWGSGSPATVTVSLIVTKACQINTGTMDVDFGTKALISQFTRFTQTVNVTCTNNEGYSVAFDNGAHYQAPWRRMISGSDLMNYNLYQPNTAIIWNVAQPMAFVGTGVAQNFTFDALIDGTQANLPQGNYVDSVTMTLSY